MLSKPERLRSEQDFARVYKTGKRLHSKNFSLFFVFGSSKSSRFGVVISKKNAPKSVDRNKVRRKVRVILRELAKETKTGFDIVLVIKKPALKSLFSELGEDITQIFNQAKLLK